MAKNYNWRIKREYYKLINKGIKTPAVRVGCPDIKRVRKVDTITFKDYSNYPEKKEALGVYVFELQKQTNDMKLYTLSSLINNHKLFGKFAQAAYSVTDYVCKDYPKHFEWYWTKEIPRVFNGTGEVVICTINNNVAGVAFLKKDDTESKICTFLVVEDYRGKHVATKILEQAFKYLGTTKPLITIADYKISLFEHIIKKYKWKLTQTMDEGYYNNTSREFVYNGKLPE